MISTSFTEYIEVNPKIVLEKDKEYPFIEMSNVGIFQREPEKVDVKRFGSGTKFEKGDTVVARIEPCLQNGKGFYVKDFEAGFGSTEYLVFRSKDESKLDKVYLYYLMQDKYIRENMIRSMTGATGRQRVNNKIFDNIKINIPDLYKQKNMASMLKLYDDLIENNFKRIKLLEESADLIYKEWFVNFRFPGYEKCEFIDGFPSKWDKKTIKEILIKVTRKSKIKKEEYLENGAVPVIDQSRVFIGGYTNDEDAKETNIPAIIFGDHTRIVKYIDFNFASGADGTQIIYSNNSRVSQQYLYIVIKNIDLSNYSYARHFKYLKEEYIYIPSKEVAEEFTKISKNILRQISCLRNQIIKLKEARDILIPKLIMGEIEV